MVATLAQQLYTITVQTRLTAPISVKQFNQRLSHFSADNNAVWLLLQNHTRTEELKRRLQEAAEDHGPGETNPTPFLSCILFLISVFTSAGRHLGKEGPKAALPHFLPGLCMFIKGSEDIFILKLLHPRFAVSPSPVVFVFCAPFFSHHQSAAANGCSCFSQKFPPVQKELFLPTLAAQRGSLHFSIILLLRTTQHLEMSVGVKHYYIWEIFTLGRLS